MTSVQALWRRRELALVLAGSEFKSRYRRLGLGVAWAVLNPLIQSVLIAVVFSTIFAARVSQFGDLGGVHFALFVMTGMMPWSFFVGALTNGTMSLAESGQIVQRVALPRAALPTATLMVNLYNYAFMLGTLVVLTLVMDAGRLTNIWALPAVVLVHVGFVYGLTLLTSSLQVRYQDVGQLVGAAVLAWFWVTPIVYPLSILGEHGLVKTLLRVNPMTGIISGYRAAFLGLPLDAAAAWIAAGWTAFFLVVGWVVFTRREATIADFL